MHAWRRDDVAAVAADIDAGGDLPCAVANPVLADAKVAMTAFTGDDLDCWWQYAALLFELAQRSLAFFAVDIEHEDAAHRPGGDADVEVGYCLPPAVNAFHIGGGGMQAGVAGGLFAARLAWEDCKPFLRQLQRGGM